MAHLARIAAVVTAHRSSGDAVDTSRGCTIDRCQWYINRMSVSELNESGTGDSPRPCSLPRRAGAMLYDALVLVAIWMVGTAVVVIFGNRGIESGNPLYQLYLVLLAFVYFHLSWRRIGQTLGMRTWRIRIDPGDRPLTIARSLLRFVGGLASIATLGLGFAWALLRRDKRAWPDLASGSRLVQIAPDGGPASH